MPSFEIYRRDLKGKLDQSEEDRNVVATVDSLIDYLRTDYRQTIASIENLTAHGEITFELLYALLVPRCTVITRSSVTGELQALQLVSSSKICTPSGFMYNIICEGLDVDDYEDPNALGFYRTQSRMVLTPFAGTVKITSLDAYPIQYHPNEADIRRSLIARGKRWAQFTGVHHMEYKGTAGFKCDGKVVKYNVRFISLQITLMLNGYS